MCLAIAYKENGDTKEKICENVTFVEFEETKTILTDILNRKNEVEAIPKSINLSDGIIIF